MSLSSNRLFYTNTNHIDTSNVLINFHNLTGNAELNEHPLSKYARGIFFSPNYNKEFFDAINWANNLGDYKTQLNLINPYVNNVLMNIGLLNDNGVLSDQSIISHILQMGLPIDGVNNNEHSGYNISSNADGTVIAISSHWYDSKRGLVRIFKWNNSSWNNIGTIDGEAADDESGLSVSLNADGTIVAIGAPINDGGGKGYATGHVRVYKYNGSSWDQMDADIDGEAAGDQSGFSVSLSSDGTIVAIGAPYNDDNGNNSGHVRVYQYNGSSWNQMGTDINGEARDDYSGYSVSLSSDGTIVAIGASHNDGNDSDSGHVRVYKYNGSSWDQMGTDIDAEARDDRSGFSVSLSADGTIVAIGAYLNDGNGNAGHNSGHVRVYKYNGISWDQMGNDIDGEATQDYSGWSVSLSSDGTILAVGAPDNNGPANIDNIGHVRVYQYVSGLYSGDWVQVGYDLYGEAETDKFGYSVSLSKNGSTLVVGAYQHNTNVNNAGRVYTYELVKKPITSVVKMGSPIDGDGGNFGGVSLNDDGTVIAIGAYGYSGGEVRVYKYTDGTWGQIGNNINAGSPQSSGDHGRAMKLNADGTIVAIGAWQGSGNTGDVTIYKYDNINNSWDKLGDKIVGESGHDKSGYSIALSDDGTIVAIGAYDNDATDSNNSQRGHIRVYDYVAGRNPEWDKVGNDIDGEIGKGTRFGWSVSLSADGKIVAGGSGWNNGINGTNSGQVRVYDYVQGRNPEWDQLGNTIDGEAESDYSGDTISLNSDGTIIAIGASSNDGNDTTNTYRGHVRVYDFDNNRSPKWQQLGSDIDGKFENESSGKNISLSADGTILVIGAHGYSDSIGDSRGHAYVYKYMKGLYASDWVLIGDKYGEAQYDRLGWSVSVSKNGSIFALGVPGYDGNGTNSNTGSVYTYQLIEQPSIKSIVKMGEPINGEAASDYLAYDSGVSLSDDGTILAIGAHANDGNGSFSGHVRVYKYGINPGQFPPSAMTGNQTTLDGNLFKVSASSEGAPAYRAFDNIEGTSYHEHYFQAKPYNNNEYTYQGGLDGSFYSTAGYDGEWLQIELPYKINLNKFMLTNRNSWGGRMPKTGVILGQNESSWELVYTINDTNGAYSGVETRQFNVNSDKYYNTFRLVSTSLFGGDIHDTPNISNWRLVGLQKDGVLSWEQLGDDIDGEAAYDESGWVVSLSSDGTIVAIGARLNDGNGSGSGHVRVYKYNGSSWDQMGADIDGEAINDYSSGYGNCVSLSSDGTIVAIGARNNDGNGTDSGHVRVYKYNGSSWDQIGADIDGEAAHDQSGQSVSLSSDGTIVAIGAKQNDGNGTDSGHVRVYKYNGSTWDQIGADIYGEAANDQSGLNVSLSSDGTIIAIGARNNDGNGSNSGHVRVYQYVSGLYGSEWIQVGYDLDGEATNNYFGYGVSLSKDGSVLVAGAHGYNSNTGRVYTYEIV